MTLGTRQSAVFYCAATLAMLLASGPATAQFLKDLPLSRERDIESEAPPSHNQAAIVSMPQPAGDPSPDFGAIRGSGVDMLPREVGPPSEQHVRIVTMPVRQSPPSQPGSGQQLPVGFGQFCMYSGMAYGPGPAQPLGAACIIMGPAGPVQGFIN